MAVEAARSTRRLGAIRSRGRLNERSLRVGCGRREARPGRREVLQVFVRRSSSCATDESWTGVRRTNEIRKRREGGVAEEKQRDRRPKREAGFGKPSDLFRVAGVPACRGVRLSSVRRGSRRVRQETISRLPSPPRTSISSVAVKPKPSPNQVYATSR
jgi:hypothetical protein